MSLLRFLVAFGLLTGPLYAAGMDPGPPAPTDTVVPIDTLPPASRDEQVICRRESVMGSHVARRTVCRTRAQMEAERKAAQKDLERINRMPNVPSAGEG